MRDTLRSSGGSMISTGPLSTPSPDKMQHKINTDPSMKSSDTDTTK